jgi:hypothetical protein
VNDVAVSRARLADIDRELASLQGQHDLAMSAFKFDEANALQRRIVALEDERQTVVAALPEQILPPESPPPVVPLLARPRRKRRRRMG